MTRLKFIVMQWVRYFSPVAWVLASIIFINRLSAMVKLFMALYLRQVLDLPIEWVGWMLSGYGAGLLLGSLAGGILSDFFPTARLTVLLLSACSIALASLGFVIDVYLLAGLLVMGGIFDGAVRTLHQRLIMEYCEVSDRQRTQALNRVAANLGMAVAGLMGGMLAQIDFRWLFFISAIFMVVGLVWFARTILHRAVQVYASTPSSNGQQSPYKKREFRWLLVATIFLGLAFEPVYSMLGNYLADYYQFGTNVIGWQFALNALLIVALQVPISHWTEHWGVRQQILTGCVLLACGFGMLPFGSGLFFVSLSTILWTLGEILFLPALNILVMQFAQSGKSGQYFGIFSMCWSGSALVSPTLGGQIYGMFGGHSIWVITSLLALFSIPFVYLAVRFEPRGA
ncbi:MFS transporter [Pseudomonas sp. IPO3749]|uniref:Arabinose ABC transporter permease n=3 Tax=Pseudomonas TaxID=286 RepID=A0A0A1YS83_PSEFL|nr:MULTISPECIES: MFS transporter [Pseudomonas]KGE64468.1 arabinose ABC transporter permease [Pseudomonas fluorescens LMG 5329]NWE00353.1 MFS transporter [Pseudomonas sp. IPO3749]NWF18587.1 MFS transporter [Pseudomonas sp. IPO3749]